MALSQADGKEVRGGLEPGRGRWPCPPGDKGDSSSLWTFCFLSLCFCHSRDSPVALVTPATSFYQQKEAEETLSVPRLGLQTPLCFYSRGPLCPPHGDVPWPACWRVLGTRTQGGPRAVAAKLGQGQQCSPGLSPADPRHTSNAWSLSLATEFGVVRYAADAR